MIRRLCYRVPHCRKAGLPHFSPGMLGFYVFLDLYHGQCAAGAPFDAGGVRRLAAEIALQRHLSARLKKVRLFRACRTAEHAGVVVLSSDNGEASGGALGIGVWPRED